MARLEKVVAGIDFSEASIAAARWTSQWFAPDAELILLYVLDLPKPPAFLRPLLPSGEEVLRQARENALEKLRDLGHSLPSARKRVEVREGSPTERIAEIARETNADLVVVGEHGHRRGLRDVLGSTADQLVHASPVPVLLARGQEEAAPQRVLVPIDESPMGDRVLEWGRLLGERFGAQVMALHVLNARLLWQMRIVSSETKWQELSEDMHRGALDWLRERVRAAGFAPEQVEARVVLGEPSHEILAAAARYAADLIVLGSHGAGALERVLIGSVARAVMRGASSPVVVVTPGSD